LKPRVQPLISRFVWGASAGSLPQESDADINKGSLPTQTDRYESDSQNQENNDKVSHFVAWTSLLGLEDHA